MCKLITVDLGSFNIKVNNGDDNIVLENRFMLDNNQETYGAETITIEGNTYFFNKGSFDKEFSKAKKNIEVSLLYGLFKSGVTGDINLILHLPGNQMAQKDIIKDKLENKDFEYICNGKPNNIRIKKVGILKEGFSSFYSLAKRKGLINIIDIGGRTTDIFSFNNGNLVAEKSIPIGTIEMFSEIADRLVGNGENRTAEDIKTLIDNEIIDIKDYEDILKKYAESVANEAKVKIPNLNDGHNYITGGGAEYLVDYIKDHYKKVSEMQNKLFSNVIGAYNIGKAKKW